MPRLVLHLSLAHAGEWAAAPLMLRKLPWLLVPWPQKGKARPWQLNCLCSDADGRQMPMMLLELEGKLRPKKVKDFPGLVSGQARNKPKSP